MNQITEFKKHVESFIQSQTNLSENSIKSYRYDLKQLIPIVNKVGFKNINNQIVHEFIANRIANGKRSIRLIFLLNEFFDYLINIKEYTGENPAKDLWKIQAVDEKKPREYLDAEKFRKVFNVLKLKRDNYVDAKTSLFVLLSMFTGIQLKELITLEWDWFDTKNEFIMLFKRKEEIKVPLYHEVMNAFINYRDLVLEKFDGIPGKYVFFKDGKYQKTKHILPYQRHLYKKASGWVGMPITFILLEETYRRLLADKIINVHTLNTLFISKGANVYVKKPEEEAIFKDYKNVFDDLIK
jgi:site-specific recombinase XerD